MIERMHSGYAALNAKPAYQYALLAAIIVLAAVLRFYKLGEWSFWLDEVKTVSRALDHYDSLEAIVRTVTSNGWMPLSVITTAGAVNALGVSEWSARFVPAVVGVLSIPILYFPVKRIFGWQVGMVAALLLAVAPWHLYWSQNARFYSAMMLFYFLALLAFFVAIEQDRPGYILLGLLLFYLASSERLIALFLVPVVASYLLLLKILPFEKPPGLRVRNLILFLIPGIAYAILEVYRFVTSGISNLVDLLNVFGLRPIDDPARTLILVTFNIGIPLVVFAFFSGIFLLQQKSRAGLLLMVSAVLPPLLLAAVNPFLFTVDRYVFVVLPSWIVLAAIGVKEIFARTQHQGIVLALGVLLLLLADATGAHLMYFQVNNGNRLAWREAFDFVQRRVVEDDVVVSSVADVGNYYMDGEVVSLTAVNPADIENSGNRTWFVIDEENGWWAARNKLWVERNSDLLNVSYLRVRENINLSIYLFDPERNVVGE